MLFASHWNRLMRLQRGILGYIILYFYEIETANPLRVCMFSHQTPITKQLIKSSRSEVFLYTIIFVSLFFKYFSVFFNIDVLHITKGICFYFIHAKQTKNCNWSRAKRDFKDSSGKDQGNYGRNQSGKLQNSIRLNFRT